MYAGNLITEKGKGVKKMKKILLLTICALMVFAMAGIVYAAPSDGRAGKSKIAHISLFEKTCEPDWNVSEDGATGQMTYTLKGPEFCFTFNGKGLEPAAEYTLIIYNDPWPGSPICLGAGTVNGGGEYQHRWL